MLAGVILAGGRGSRLDRLTDEYQIPKALLCLPTGEPLIDRLIRYSLRRLKFLRSISSAATLRKR